MFLGKRFKDMVYGYCRISTTNQSIDRQVENILREYPSAIIYKEAWSGRSMNRPEWNKLKRILQKGDIVCMDEVSRLSRTCEEGIDVYEELFNNGIDLVFLKESYVNTSVYRKALKTSIELTDTNLDYIINGINQYLIALAKEQIRIAFQNSQREVDFLRQRTREGIREAKARGSQIGNIKGVHLITKKSISSKEIILKHSKTFGGSLNDYDVIKLCECTRGTYYKYKRELLSSYET